MQIEELKELLDRLRSIDKENEWVEFKGNNSKPEDIGEYISALSNSACLHKKSFAYLVYGIENKTHNVVGTEFKPKKRKVGGEELENWLSRNLSPRIDFEIYEINYENENVVLFKINATKDRPVEFKGTKWIRVGSYKKRLRDHPEKERKIWERTSGYTFERGICKGMVHEDEVLSLIDYPNYFRLMHQKLPTNKSHILDKLTEEKIIIKRKSGFYDITNLGGILFSTDLTKFEKLSRKAVRVIIYKGTNKLKAIKEYVSKKGYAVGFEDLIHYINEQLPQSEEIGKALRKNVKMYPEIIIRELIPNALIHQDFGQSGTSPMVEIFEDRIEISNSGKPLIDTLRFIDHNPVSRNEKLAEFMRRMNICEERGSGIDKVITAIEIYQLPAPKFIDDSNFLRVIVYSSKSFRLMDKDDKIRACYQHCVLRFVSNKVMTNSTLRERFNIHQKNYPMASLIIRNAIKQGLIKSQKNSRYIPFWA